MIKIPGFISWIFNCPGLVNLPSILTTATVAKYLRGIFFQTTEAL